MQAGVAVLSGRLGLLAVLLYGQLIYYAQIALCPDRQLLGARRRACRSFLSCFLLWFHLRRSGVLGEFWMGVLA